MTQYLWLIIMSQSVLNLPRNFRRPKTVTIKKIFDTSLCFFRRSGLGWFTVFKIFLWNIARVGDYYKTLIWVNLGRLIPNLWWASVGSISYESPKCNHIRLKLKKRHKMFGNLFYVVALIPLIPDQSKSNFLKILLRFMFSWAVSNSCSCINLFWRK